MNVRNKILIVDDDADTAEVLAVILSPSFQCKAVDSREKALSEIKAGFLPECVMMDYMMPGMSLQDFLRESKPWGLNIVLMTGHDEAVAMAEFPGITTSLQKPVPPEVILKIVVQIVKASKI